jgi:hypothetical protein
VGTSIKVARSVTVRGTILPDHLAPIMMVRAMKPEAKPRARAAAMKTAIAALGPSACDKSRNSHRQKENAARVPNASQRQRGRNARHTKPRP